MKRLLNAIVLRSLCLADGFRREVRGVAAVEFAFIAPIMILLFVGTIELSAGISTNRKLSRLSSTLGDLVTQSQQLTPGDLDAILDVSEKVMYPYDGTVTMVVTGVNINASGVATVHWSRSNVVSAKKTAGAPYTVPANIRKPNTYLVAAEVTTTYTPSFGWASYDTGTKLMDFSRTPIQMREELFLRPRIGVQTICVPISC